MKVSIPTACVSSTVCWSMLPCVAKMIHQHNLLAHTQPFETLRKPFGIRVKCYADSYRIPIVGTRMEFDDTPSAEPSRISHDDAFALLQDILEEVDISIWVVLDRLDEAFQGFPNIEIPALRALLRTYLDLRAFPRVILKLFVRRDFDCAFFRVLRRHRHPNHKGECRRNRRAGEAGPARVLR
jgi:hypothetical protein